MTIRNDITSGRCDLGPNRRQGHVFALSRKDFQFVDTRFQIICRIDYKSDFFRFYWREAVGIRFGIDLWPERSLRDKRLHFVEL